MERGEYLKYDAISQGERIFGFNYCNSKGHLMKGAITFKKVLTGAGEIVYFMTISHYMTIGY